MKVLVTGGAGFIGSNLVDRLLAEGMQVVVVDNLSSGFRENVAPAATFYELSITDDAALRAVFERERPDYVCHYAAQIDVRKSVLDPGYDASVNVLGSLNVIRATLDFGVKKIVYVSTGGAAYGEPEYLPVDEKHPVNPLCPYGISKHAVEHYLYMYAYNDGLRYTVLRYPNVYGPRQNPHGEAGVVAIFTEKLLEGQPPIIFGDGKQTRDYTFVEDVVAATILALEKGDGEIYNVGTEREVDVWEIIRELNEALGMKVEPILAEARKGEVRRICLSAAKLRRELGWEPRYSFRDGLRKTVEYYRQRRES